MWQAACGDLMIIDLAADKVKTRLFTLACFATLFLTVAFIGTVGILSATSGEIRGICSGIGSIVLVRVPRQSTFGFKLDSGYLTPGLQTSCAGFLDDS